MNVERWLKTRRSAWEQLDELLVKTDKKGVAGLDRQQLQELGRLYRSTSADLSRARALRLSGEVQSYLNDLVVRAHNQVYQTDRNRWKEMIRFLWSGFPELLQENFLYFCLSICLFAIPLLGGYVMTVKDLDFAQLEVVRGQPLVPENLWPIIEEQKMWTDGVEEQSPVVFSLIATNNIKVSIMAFVLGIFFGLGTVYILFVNGLSIGTTFGVCYVNGMAGKLLAFIAPHGVLELTAIFISGAAGLVMGKALLFPGQYKRSDMFKKAARRAAGLFAGTVPILLVAGCIEGFISPRTDISVESKYLISLSTLVFLLLYLFVPRQDKSDSTAAKNSLE
ncbi:MAG: stage II sporulation protein M [Candidatus Obscuribacterales bacterium]|nr:stage II sporulation protein M [Candidatus Obscuribacterales bacterium]